MKRQDLKKSYNMKNLNHFTELSQNELLKTKGGTVPFIFPIDFTVLPIVTFGDPTEGPTILKPTTAPTLQDPDTFLR